MLGNYIFAGVAEDERLRIMERTVRGRIQRAREGKPWSGDPPVGRAYDAKTGWYVTDKGKAIAKLLERYLEGEGTSQLEREFGIRAAKVSQLVHNGQLAGTYKARFRCPELDIDEVVPVPAVPEVVSTAVLELAKARLAFNRTNNRRDIRKYYLTGFLRCANCGRALTGRSPHKVHKTYYHGNHADGCLLRTVPGDELEKAVLDHLYGAFLDQPTFNAAVERALPSVKDRKALDKEIVDIEKRLAENHRKIGRLVDAIANGADVELLLTKQEALKAEKETLSQRATELRAKARALPDVEQVQRAAMLTRLRLITEHTGKKDWRKLPFEDVRRFLLHLFGEVTSTSGTGMLVSKDAKGQVTVTFKGRVDFHHLLANSRPITEAFVKEAARMSTEISNVLTKGAKEADARLDTQRQELEGVSKPYMAYLSARKTQVRATLSVCSSSPPM